ncbi:MAG TPA: PAS domain S-box protein [Terriglobales bacterium]|nr:PAS domain S-box protein [Terriglobales bacterium]
MENRVSSVDWFQQSSLRRYGVAAVAIGAAAIARSMLDGFIGDLLPYVFFFPAVAFSAYLGGRGPALFAMASGLVIANYLFVPPRYQTLVFSSSSWVGSVAFVVANLTVVFVTDMMRLERARAEAFARQAEAERKRVVQEMAERKKKEDELKTSEEKFRAVAETAANAIYIHDGTRLVFVNPAAESITGYSRQELLASDMWELVHPDFRERVRANAKARFLGEPCPLRYEYKIITKDGEERWLDFSANVVEFDGKKCILATAFDVTDRKMAEDTLRKTEKLAATGRLAATIAHEINNPLEAVTNLLYLMRTDAANSETYLQMAEQELKRVAHLTKQTLGFYRETTQPVKTRLAVLLEEVISIYSARLTHRRITVEKDMDESCEVTAFPGELRQVFSNLVSNAADAMSDGGRLQIRVRQVKGFGSPHGAQVTIADDGTGMNPAVLRHIYEPFFTTKEDVGTGLGMWVTKGIVEKHNGMLRVRSSTGKLRHGTVFSLFLPASREGETGASAA